MRSRFRFAVANLAVLFFSLAGLAAAGPPDLIPIEDLFGNPT